MTKKTNLFLAFALVLASLASCAQPAPTADSGQSQGEPATPFQGSYVVNASYVAENLDSILLVDARGENAAKKSTITGAIALDWQYLATCEDGATGDENWGCILDLDRLNARLSEKGLDPSQEIVLFSTGPEGWGEDGRIAWELIAAGYENVKIVDGGFSALEDTGLDTSKGGITPDPVQVNVESIDETHVINTDELKEHYEDFVVLDVRTAKEYQGATSYGEENGGHLPGAIHLEYTSLFQGDGTLKSQEELVALFEGIGLSTEDQIVAYCTAGIRSAYMQLVLEMCGFANSQNYDESFYRWSAVEALEGA